MTTTEPTIPAQAPSTRAYIPQSIAAPDPDDETSASVVLEYREPPINRLPTPLAEYVAKSAEAIGCDPCLVAMPALAACASAIGDSRAIEIKAGWIEFSTLWTTVISSSGTQKTPAMKAAMQGLEALQRKGFESYSVAESLYKTEINKWNNTGKSGSEPVAPVLKSNYISDATLEAVCARLHDNPRGMLQKRDELSGWLGSFDRYTSGNEAAQWLEFHSGNSVRIDRKTGDTPVVFIPRALVSVTGTIQRPILQKLLGGDEAKHFDNGLAARFLMAMPPERERVWRETTVVAEVVKSYTDLFEDLLALQPQIDSVTGRRDPILLRWAPEAKTRFIEFFNEHGKEMRAFKSDRLKSAWSKLEAQAVRLALVFHCVRHAHLPGPDTEALTISLDTLEAALAWVEWLKNETRRIYYTLAHSGETRNADKLLSFVRKCGGRCTARDAARLGAGGRTADAVEKVMQSLVVAGFGKWETPEQPNGGRPTRYFRLTTDAPTNDDADTKANSTE